MWLEMSSDRLKNGQTFLAFSSNKLYNFENEFFIIASENEFL